MAIVAQKDNNVCACGSNRTWLLILATIEIISNAIFLVFVIATLCVMRDAVHQSKRDPAVSDFEEFMLSFGTDVLIVSAVFFALCLFAAFCPVIAESKKRPGFLIPWYVLIISGFVSDIVIGVICLVHSDFPAFMFVLIQLTLDLFAIIVTKRRYEELQRFAVAAENGLVVSGGGAANYGAAVESGSGYKPLQ